MMYKFTQQDSRLSLEVSKSELSKVKKWVLKSAPNETGGVIIGKYSKSGNTVRISEFWELPDIESTSTRYERPSAKLNKRLETLSKLKSNKDHYLGEWHSHPSNSPTPSLQDIASMAKLIKSDTLPIESPILMIIGIIHSKCCWSACSFNSGQISQFSYPII